MAKLVVIGTPIGNLEDISFRALKRLGEVETLICEDTRVTGKLLHLYQNKGWLERIPRLVTYNDFNARKKLAEIKEIILQEKLTGLVSDAGMPLVSDPGYRLVRFCYDQSIEVEVVPGPSAVTMAMVMAGIGGNKFWFQGFLAKKAGKRKKELETIKQVWEVEPSLQVILFVSPYRLIKVLETVRESLGEDTKVVLLRELTKKFEERRENTVKNLLAELKTKKIKGELVLVLSQTV